MVNCTDFLLRVLVFGFQKVLKAKRTVSINSTGLLLSVLIIGSMLDVELILGYSLGVLQIPLLSSQL